MKNSATLEQKKKKNLNDHCCCCCCCFFDELDFPSMIFFILFFCHTGSRLFSYFFFNLNSLNWIEFWLEKKNISLSHTHTHLFIIIRFWILFFFSQWQIHIIIIIIICTDSFMKNESMKWIEWMTEFNSIFSSGFFSLLFCFCLLCTRFESMDLCVRVGFFSSWVQ